MFNCKRCGYSTNIRGNLRNHLNRKRICNAVFKDINIETLKDELIEQTINLIDLKPVCQPASAGGVGKALGGVGKSLGGVGDSTNYDTGSAEAFSIKVGVNQDTVLDNEYNYSNDTLFCKNCNKIFKKKKYQFNI